MSLNKSIFLKIIFLCLIFFSFFVGYILRENATGGGLEFYNLSWPIINSFKKDFLFTINNYGTFDDGSFPLAHIINAYINPFSDNEGSFQLSVTFISFVVFIIFSMVLKRSFNNIKYEDILLIASVLLLLPFFRTSAFWGKPENFSWLFCILSLYFFVGIRKKISQTPNNKTMIEIMLFCLFSSCALYVRQPFIFLPISYLLYLLVFQAHKKIIIFSIVSFVILSIPGLLLILSWGGLYDTKNVDYFYGLINIKFILKNIPILLSFFGFYLLPILIIEFLNKNYNYVFK